MASPPFLINNASPTSFKTITQDPFPFVIQPTTPKVSISRSKASVRAPPIKPLDRVETRKLPGIPLGYERNNLDVSEARAGLKLGFHEWEEITYDGDIKDGPYKRFYA